MGKTQLFPFLPAQINSYVKGLMLHYSDDSIKPLLNSVKIITDKNIRVHYSSFILPHTHSRLGMYLGIRTMATNTFITNIKLWSDVPNEVKLTSRVSLILFKATGARTLTHYRRQC